MSKSALKRIRAAAMTYPEAWEDTPWGEKVAKVRKKVFLFVGLREGRFTMTAKLPRSGEVALLLEFTSPCGYGLGKHGWVTSSFEQGEDIPVDLLLEWLDESYRAVAPKTLVKQLDGGVPPEKKKKKKKKEPPRTPRTPKKKKTAKKKTAKKKTANKKKANKKKANKKK